MSSLNGGFPMGTEGTRNRPPDKNADRDKMNLECIGSFYAFEEGGEKHTIEIWTHHGAMHDRDIRRVSPTQLVLTTTLGFGVVRVAQGKYQLTDSLKTSLSTDDPNAP
jgi:hypothetical protein